MASGQALIHLCLLPVLVQKNRLPVEFAVAWSIIEASASIKSYKRSYTIVIFYLTIKKFLIII